MSHRRKLLGEVLIEAGLIMSEQLAAAVERQQRGYRAPGPRAPEHGGGTENGVSQAIATQLGLDRRSLIA